MAHRRLPACHQHRQIHLVRDAIPACERVVVTLEAVRDVHAATLLDVYPDNPFLLRIYDPPGALVRISPRTVEGDYPVTLRRTALNEDGSDVRYPVAGHVSAHERRELLLTDRLDDVSDIVQSQQP